MRAFVLVGLVACFQPSVEFGAPCDNTAAEPCPPSQTCVANRCTSDDVVGASPDAPQPSGSDSGAIADRDGDGVPDDVDNCPDIPNPDQANEDGDKFGDVCDPCPVEANDNPSDPDGDGVADGCDPNPNTPGDRIALFEGFSETALGSGWQLIGNATLGGGEIALVDVAQDYTAVVPPISGLVDATVSAGILVDAEVGSADSATTIVLPYDPAQDQGIYCELYAPNATSSAGRYISLWDSPKAIERGSAALSWATATPYRMALKKVGTNYTCSVATGTSTPTATATSNSSVATGAVAIATYGASAHAQWIMVVTSP